MDQATNLTACTLMPEPNSTYLVQTRNVPVIAEPMSGTTTGLLMLLSTLQYQAPYVSPQYSSAAQQAGKAAYIQSGGQGLQDKATAKITAESRDAGITDTEAGIVLGSAKIIRDKQVDLNGPKIFFIKTHVTMGQDHGQVGFKVEF